MRFEIGGWGEMGGMDEMAEQGGWGEMSGWDEMGS